MKRYDLIFKFLQDQTEDDLIFIYNQQCDHLQTIFPMEQFDEVMTGKTAFDVADIICESDGEFYTRDSHFSWDFDSDRLISTSTPCQDWIDIESLASRIDDRNDSFGIPELEFILSLDEIDVDQLTKTMAYVDSLELFSRKELELKYGERGTFELARQITIRLFGF